jgi:hypothetical protein
MRGFRTLGVSTLYLIFFDQLGLHENGCKDCLIHTVST